MRNEEKNIHPEMELNEKDASTIFGGGTEEVQTLNESDLEQVSGGVSKATFRCPACGCTLTAATAKTGWGIGEEGPVCTKCTDASGQGVRMIRIS